MRSITGNPHVDVLFAPAIPAGGAALAVGAGLSLTTAAFGENIWSAGEVIHLLPHGES
jgi:hypothetical protein